MDKLEEKEQVLKMLNDIDDGQRTYEYFKLTIGKTMKYCQETGQFYLLDEKEKKWIERPDLATCYFNNFLMAGEIEDYPDTYPTDEEEGEKIK